MILTLYDNPPDDTKLVRNQQSSHLTTGSLSLFVYVRAPVRNPSTFLNERPCDLFYRANHPTGTRYRPAIQED